MPAGKSGRYVFRCRNYLSLVIIKIRKGGKKMSEIASETGADIYGNAARWVACGVVGALLVGGLMADCGKKSGGGGGKTTSHSSSWKVTGGYGKHNKHGGYWQAENLTAAIVGGGMVAVEDTLNAANIEGLLSEPPTAPSVPLTSLVERPGRQE